VKGWALVILIAVLMILWVGAIYLLLPDRPRAWDYGQTQYIPAQGYYSSGAAPTGPAERQVPPVPPPQEPPR
jgi:hypothetical protein